MINGRLLELGFVFMAFMEQVMGRGRGRVIGIFGIVLRKEFFWYWNSEKK
jgi:hypothetical protein